MRLNDREVGFINAMLANSQDGKFARYFCVPINGMTASFSICTAAAINATVSAQVYMCPYCNVGELPCRKIALRVASGFDIPAGTVIRIYGVWA